MTEPSAAPDLLNELAHDFAERYRRGERPSLTEYSARYPELAAEIRDLFPALVVVEEFGSVGGAPDGPGGRTALPDGTALRQLGEYRILREVARGGMGIVYEAVQESLGRHAALKVLPFQSLASAGHLERFRREARAAANLHHTNIVPVFGVGEHEGVHYFAMQFIQGQALNVVLHELKRLRQGKGTPPGEPAEGSPAIHDGRDGPERSASLAGGLMTGEFPGQAEERRDLPGDEPPPAAGPAARGGSASTAMVSGDPSELGVQSETQYFRSVARVGVQVAEALAYAHGQGILHRDIKPSNLLLDRQGTVWIIDFGLAKAEGADDLTNTGDIVGTLRYMAPERLRGQADARSDVFGLGLTLYEMATLRPAFAGSERAQLIEQILHDEPPRPRTADPHVPRDLETIILKAIAREPGQRYQSAAALAEDLRCFLGDRTIQARRSTARERTWRWCRRNPVVATLLGLTAALVGMVAVVASLAAWRLNVEQNATREQLRSTEQAEDQATRRLYRSLVEQARASRLSRRLGQRSQSLEVLAEAARMARDMDLPEEDFRELRSEAIACLALPDLRTAAEWPGWPTGSLRVDFDSALERYARVDRQGAVSVRRVAGDAEIYRLPSMGPGEAFPQFSADGQFLAVGRGGRLQVWKRVGQESVAVIDEPSGVGPWTFSPDSRQLAVGHGDGSIRLYDLSSGQELKQIAGPLARGLAFHPRDRRLAISCAAGVQIRDLDSGKVLADFLEPTGEWEHGVAWQPPDGKILAAAAGDRAIHLWDVATGKQIARLEGHKSDGINFAFNHAGDLLVSTCWDGLLRLWDPRTGQQLFNTQTYVQSLRFSPDDQLLAAGIDDNKLRLWEVARPCGYRTLVRDPLLGRGEYHDCATSPEGPLLAVGMLDGVGLWDMTTGNPLQFLPLGRCCVVKFATSDTLLTNGAAGLLYWPIRIDSAADLVRIGPPQKLPLPGNDCEIAASRDGRVVASAQRWGGLVWHQDLQGPPIPASPHDDTRYIAVSPDGRWAATGSHWGTKVEIWDARTGKPAHELPVETGSRVCFSPDGRWLATSGGGWRLWIVDSWQEGPPIGGRGELAFCPDEQRNLLAVETGYGVVRLLNPDTGREYARLEDPNHDRAGSIAFSPDGTQLVVNGEEQSLHVWDLRTIREQLTRMGLDWDLPPYPPAGAPNAAPPLRAVVDMGTLGSLAPDEPQAAVAKYSLAIALLPINPEAYLRRGSAYFSLGQWRKAADDLTLAVALGPACNDPDVWFKLAYAWGALGQRDKAIADYSKVLGLRSDDAKAWHNRGWEYSLLGQWDKAVADYSKALELELAPAEVLTRNDRADAYSMLGQWDKAVADRSQAFELSTKSAEDHNNLAWLLATCPDPKFRDAGRAVALAKKAIELASNDGHFWNTLGVAHYCAGDWKACVKALEKSIELRNGGDGFDWFFLAMAQWRLGKREEAHQSYDRAVQWMERHKQELENDKADEQQLRRFRAEAAELLGIKDQPASKGEAKVPGN